MAASHRQASPGPIGAASEPQERSNSTDLRPTNYTAADWSSRGPRDHPAIRAWATAAAQRPPRMPRIPAHTVATASAAGTRAQRTLRGVAAPVSRHGAGGGGAAQRHRWRRRRGQRRGRRRWWPRRRTRCTRRQTTWHARSTLKAVSTAQVHVHTVSVRAARVHLLCSTTNSRTILPGANQPPASHATRDIGRRLCVRRSS